MKRRILSLAVLAWVGGWSSPRLATAAPPLTELVDVPTAEVVDHYGFMTTFRFYTGGGVLSRAHFGVLPRLNVGFGLDAEHFVGGETIDLNRPTLNVRFRFFDGRRSLPALALGYDGQGHFFDKSIDRYRQREKGLYLAGSGEFLIPDLSLHGGVNIYDFHNDHVYGFAALNYLVQDTVGFLAEWDNIRRGRDSRVNLGGRFHVTPSFYVDVAGRDLFGPGRRAERIVRLTYSGSF
jgi:hypothetical protein